MKLGYIKIQENGLLAADDVQMLENYFKALIDLLAKHRDNEFVVDLNDVWPLAYSRKDNAVRELEDKFIENIDYQVFRRNAENPYPDAENLRSNAENLGTSKLNQGGRPTASYMLTIQCMEFLIARKVRAVFEVYRRIFHAMLSAVTFSPTDDLTEEERRKREEKIEEERCDRIVCDVLRDEVSNALRVMDYIFRFVKFAGKNVETLAAYDRVKAALCIFQVDITMNKSHDQHPMQDLFQREYDRRYPAKP